MSTAKQRKRKEHRILFFALALVIVIPALVMILRLTSSSPLYPVGESYYNLHLVRFLGQNPSLATDPIQRSVYEPNPYHYLLTFLYTLLPVEAVSLFLPIVLGLACALLLFKLLKLIKVKPNYAAYSIVILSVTPVFIALSTGLYTAAFTMLLSLLATVLILDKKMLSQVFGALSLIILALTSLTGFILTIGIILFLSLALKKVKKTLRTLVFSLIISIIISIPLTLLTNYTPRILGFHSFAFRNVFSILNAEYGFSVFLLILFLIGFIVLWINDKDKVRKLFHLPVLLLVVLSFFNTVARVYASFIITFYCVVAIIYFYKRRWHLKIVRQGTLLLILCSLLFSSLNQINLLIDAQPDKDMLDALLFLRPAGSGDVLTLEENGFLVEFYSYQRVLLDSNSFLNQEYPQMKDDVQALFMVTRLNDAEPLLTKQDVRYILITPYMKEELWESREQGLWFLVKHSESFDKIYKEAEIEIWKYLGVPELEG